MNDRPQKAADRTSVGYGDGRLHHRERRDLVQVRLYGSVVLKRNLVPHEHRHITAEGVEGETYFEAAIRSIMSSCWLMA